MSTNAKHTPTPWVASPDEYDEELGQWTIRDDNDGYIADVRNPYTDYDMQVAYAADPACRIRHDAAFIVRAVNSHEALVDALIWCSGSPSFAPDGEAREGWLKLCQPLIDASLNDLSKTEGSGE